MLVFWSSLLFLGLVANTKILSQSAHLYLYSTRGDIQSKNVLIFMALRKANISCHSMSPFYPVDVLKNQT